MGLCWDRMLHDVEVEVEEASHVRLRTGFDKVQEMGFD